MIDSIWSESQTEGRQSYIVYMLSRFRHYDENDTAHLRSIAVQLDRISGEHHDFPENFHDSQYRRIITRDIDAINRNMDIHSVITTGANGAKIASKKEAANEYDKLRKKALKTLAKAHRIAKKAGLDRQMDITGEEIKIFMEENNE